MKIRGPILTLGAVVVLGAGILLVNISKEQSAPPANPYKHTTTTAAAATPAPPPPAPSTPPPVFPAKADYVGKVPTADRTVTVEITVDGDKAIAYACDGNTVEAWLRGSAINGAVTGVQRREDGSTTPAPKLTTDGIADIDGIEVRAIRVEGDSDV